LKEEADMPDKKRILVVDDDEVTLNSLKKLLVLSNFEVETTQDPKGALTMVKYFKPDLMLLDLMMPGLGGFEICDILNKDTEIISIPIIVISAIGHFRDIKKVVKKRRLQGVIGCVAKPYKFKHLLRLINKALPDTK
jgi:two-component system alkaline phosphatase synthesis response regulator PhoP